MNANISPLAQTFKVDESFTGGVLLTSADLFFATKDSVTPVEIQIVDTLNGYPTDLIVEGSKVVLSASSVTASATSLVPTKFKFDSLVFLESGKEYAIKVLTNSPKYKVWTSVMGEKRIDNPAVLITQQPALGSLFKSQNNSTWTPEQLQDLTFRLNRAKFNTGVIGNISLVEAPTNDIVTLVSNPFMTTNGQTTVKVHHINHGYAPGMLVTYSGSTDATFNSQFSVLSVINSDYYTIGLASAASATNKVGGSDVQTEQSIKYDTIMVSGISEGREVGTKVTARLSNSINRDATDTDITPEYFTDLTSNKYVYTSANRVSKLAGVNSFNLKVALSSNNDAMSPGIDLELLSVDLLSNKINNPSSTDIDFNIDGETIVVGASNVSFDAVTNNITIPSTTDYTKIKEGAWVKILDAGGLNDGLSGYISEIDTFANTLTVVGDTLVTESNRSATVEQYISFISETSNGGTAESKHITKQVNLTNKSTGFRILVDANIHTDAELELYYRTGLQNAGLELSNVGWSKHDITYKKSVNETDFIEYEFNITDLDLFDQFQLKFVLLSSNTAVTPKLKLLRVIAHA